MAGGLLSQGKPSAFGLNLVESVGYAIGCGMPDRLQSFPGPVSVAQGFSLF